MAENILKENDSDEKSICMLLSLLTLLMKKAPDERAPYRIGLLFDGIVYDTAACFSRGGLQTLIADTIPKSRGSTFASDYASLSEKAEEDMRNTTDLYPALQS